MTEIRGYKMNNISAIGYNIQALFNQVSTLGVKVATLENEILQAKVPTQKTLDDTRLSQIEERCTEIEKRVKESLNKLEQEVSVMTMAFATAAAPVQEAVVNAQPIETEPSATTDPNEATLDDLVMSVTPAKPKNGGRKKKN